MIKDHVVIRCVKANELYRVYEIEVKSFNREAYPFNLFYAYYILFNDLFLVATFLNKVIGYVIGVVEKVYEERCGHIISIAVDPLYRGFGVGKKLMLEIERRMILYNVSSIFLEVRVDNKVAINLYKKLGYNIVSILPRYYGTVDAYLMKKDVERYPYTTR